METIDKTLSEVGQLYHRVTGKPPPELGGDVAIPAIPEGTDPLVFVLNEVQYLKQELAARAGYQAAIQATVTPPIDAHLTSGKLCIKVDLPGLKRDQVSVHTTGNTLVLRGTRSHRSPRDEQGQTLALERVQGTFERYIPLPMRLKVDEMKIEMDDGVLDIKIPLLREEDEETPFDTH